MKLAPLALGLALSASLSASTPAAVTATLHRSAGLSRLEVAAGESGWTFRGDAAKGIHVVAHKDGSATVLVMDQVMAAGAVTLVMEKDGQSREVVVSKRIKI